MTESQLQPEQEVLNPEAVLRSEYGLFETLPDLPITIEEVLNSEGLLSLRERGVESIRMAAIFDKDGVMERLGAASRLEGKEQVTGVEMSAIAEVLTKVLPVIDADFRERTGREDAAYEISFSSKVVKSFEDDPLPERGGARLPHFDTVPLGQYLLPLAGPTTYVWDHEFEGVYDSTTDISAQIASAIEEIDRDNIEPLEIPEGKATFTTDLCIHMSPEGIPETVGEDRVFAVIRPKNANFYREKWSSWVGLDAPLYERDQIAMHASEENVASIDSIGSIALK